MACAFITRAAIGPKLPPEFEGRITAKILAPSPKVLGRQPASDNKKEQYLAAAGDNGVPHVKCVQPFEKMWPATSVDYPGVVFEEFDSGLMIEAAKPTEIDGAAKMQAVLENTQPDGSH